MKPQKNDARGPNRDPTARLWHPTPLLILLLGVCGLTPLSTQLGLVRGFQSPKDEAAIIEGTAYDPWYSNRMDVVVPNGGQVVLKDLRGKALAPVSLDELGAYRLQLSAGIYEICFFNSRRFLPYRRARIRALLGSRDIVNLYPVAKAGLAFTVKGDIALPEPKFLYEAWYPDKNEPDLDMLIQYESRAAVAAGFKYEGGFLTLTFDRLTLRTSELVVNQKTLAVEAPQRTFVDTGGFRVEADRASLNSRERVVTVFRGDVIEKRHF